MTNLVTIILACLSMIESGDNDLAVGDKGRSRGRYQISEAVWKELYPTVKFVRAFEPDWSYTAAKSIIVRRMDAFKTLFHRDPTPFEIYVLWNAPGKLAIRQKSSAKRRRGLKIWWKRN
jgi:hypothetical protein